MRLRAEDLPADTRDRLMHEWGVQPAGKKPNKYRAQVTWIDNIRFPSKLQAAHYGILKQMKLAKEIDYFFREVNFDLPGGMKHRVDWMVIKPAGIHVTVIFADSKGSDLPMGRLKRAQVKALYGIEIQLWTDPKRIDL